MLLLWLSLFSTAPAGTAQTVPPFPTYPIYARESITNAATSQPNRISPYTLISIYGKDLANFSWQASMAELLAQRLPLRLQNTSLSVRLGEVFLPLLYVSPTQINCLVPASLRPGVFELRLNRSGILGPIALVEVLPESPELFRVDLKWVAATHPDGRVVSEAAPALPGSEIVLYGTGFGATANVPLEGQFVGIAAQLLRRQAFRVRLNEEELSVEAVLYVGLTPGFAGLYQVNIQLPGSLPENPFVAVGLDGNWSAPGPRIPTLTIATSGATLP